MVMPERRRPDRAYLDSNLFIPKSAVNVEGTKNALTFTYYEGQRREEKSLFLFRETRHHIQVPREFWDPAAFPFEVVDCRPQTYTKTNVRSRIKLDHQVDSKGRLAPSGEDLQQRALDALLKSRGGILQLACGKGKTVIALELIARLKVPAIIIVDNTTLMHQWQKAIEEFLDVPGGVGLIQAEVSDWKKSVVLATYHTLAARADQMSEQMRRWFGIAIWDEAHHVNAPTFSKSADLFYGRRYGLTATPKRDDGLHVIHEFHFGDILYRDLSQDLRPRIVFQWTGLTPDTSDPAVAEAVSSKHGELNLGRLASYYGQWRPRLTFIIDQVRTCVAAGRKVLVLSNSVDELVNLLAIWNGQSELYTDVPVPPPEEVGETLQPVMLEPLQLGELRTKINATHVRIKHYTAQNKRSETTELTALLELLEMEMKQHEVAKKVEKVVNQRQAEYRKKLLGLPSTAGLMIHKVPSADRMAMLTEKQVTFAIAKYGKEGLNSKALDTIIMCEPVSSKNTIQQVLGRALRHMPSKQQPLIIVLEDNVGPIMGMCKKMRKHFRTWPVDESGPYEYEFADYPESMRRQR